MLSEVDKKLADKYLYEYYDNEELAALLAEVREDERERCAKICEETYVEPGDLQVESCHEPARKIRSLKLI